MRFFLCALLFGLVGADGNLSKVSTATATPCVDPAWTYKEIVIQKNIQYGSALDAAKGKTVQLTLDAYFPPSSDKRDIRPSAVLVHGGSFETGSKTSDDEPELALNLAMRGFVVVSINYRLDGYYYTLSVDKAELAAQEDARAAIRYVRKMAKDWRVDTERIMLAGDSAGAITSLYVGYVKKAQYEGNSGNPGFSSEISLAVSVSGELKDEAFCSRLLPKPAGCAVEGDAKYDHTADVDGSKFQPPLLMVHGTFDSIVPYVNGLAVYDRAKASNIKSKLITIPGAGHVPFDELFRTGTYFRDFMTFVVDAMTLGSAECPSSSETVLV